MEPSFFQVDNLEMAYTDYRRETLRHQQAQLDGLNGLLADAKNSVQQQQALVERVETTLGHQRLLLARAEGRCKALEEEKDALVLTLRHTKAELSPAARLPAEILSEIFRLVKRWTIAVHIKNLEWRGKYDDTSLVLSWVCGHWRAVAHDTSEIWTTLEMNWSRGKEPAQALSVRHYCQHAKEEPLTLLLQEFNAMYPIRAHHPPSSFLPLKRFKTVILIFDHDISMPLYVLKEVSWGKLC